MEARILFLKDVLLILLDVARNTKEGTEPELKAATMGAMKTELPLVALDFL